MSSISASTCSGDGTIKSITICYLPSLDMAMTLYLGTVCIFESVRVSYSKQHSRNRLTMLPYHLMSAAEFFCLCYLIFNNILKTNKQHNHAEENWIFFLLTMTMVLQNLAINVQIFEWLSIFVMIMYQKPHNMDTVEVVRDKFRPIEERIRCAYYFLIGIFSLGPFAIDVIALLVHSIND